MTQKFGLGRGLADLKTEMGHVPELSVLAGGERIVVRYLQLDQIAPNPDQPRKTFTPEELADLAASIKEKGVLQPILVQAAQGRAHQYEIVAGERRWRAARAAGLTEIPALVKTFTPESAMEIALIENVQRENLNPVEEGAAYKNLMEKCGYDIADVSRLIGKSESYIRNAMRLDTLPESVKEMVRAGDLSASHARTIAVAENPEALAREITCGGLSVADASKLVKSAPRSGKSRSFASNSMPAEIISEYERQIKQGLGFRARIKEKKGGAGDIALHFDTRVQLDELVAKLATK
jgi:ParB family chromosome partitioning protein